MPINAAIEVAAVAALPLQVRVPSKAAVGPSQRHHKPRSLSQSLPPSPLLPDCRLLHECSLPLAVPYTTALTSLLLHAQSSEVCHAGCPCLSSRMLLPMPGVLQLKHNAASAASKAWHSRPASCQCRPQSLTPALTLGSPPTLTTPLVCNSSATRVFLSQSDGVCN